MVERSDEVRAPRRRSWLRRIGKWCLWIAILWFVVTSLLVVVFRFVPPPTSAFMLERRLSAIAHGDKNFLLKYRWTPASGISTELPMAMIASEDQKFPTHHGFDVQAIQDAMDEADEGERQRGASTISQQTAKNLFLWGGHSFVRKGVEAYFTVLIELTWPKRRILEVYMNIAEFGDGIYGADAAAHEFFHKPPSQLTSHEAAILASVLPNPKKMHADKPGPYMQRHADWIERQVKQLGGVSYLPR